MRTLRRLGCALCWLLVGAHAYAATAYTQGVVNLRAGPSTGYPRVLMLPPDSRVAVEGCLEDYSWCDVDAAGDRGWVYARNLYYDYEQRRVPVIEFGPQLGLGVVTFTIGDYWDRHYRQRPWYRRESYWAQRLPPHRPSPSPAAARPGEQPQSALPNPPPRPATRPLHMRPVPRPILPSVQSPDPRPPGS